VNARDETPRAAFVKEMRAITSLATPVAIAQLGMMALGVVDTIMVGHLSEHALAAVALGNSYTFSLMILGMGVLMVLDPLIAQAYGAGDSKRLSEALHRGVVLAFLLSIVFGVVFWFGEPLLEVIANSSTVVPTAHRYTQVIAFGLPAFFLFLAMKQTLQAMGSVRPVIYAVVIGNLANVFLNLGFVHGEFGLPALGAVGSGWASSICRWLMVGVIVAAARPALASVWSRPTRAVLHPTPYGAMLTKGIQIGVQSALEVWLFTATSFLMLRISVVAMGGHAVAMNLVSFSFMIPFGIGAAASARVGQAIGRGDTEGARLSAKCSLLLGGSVMLVFSLVFFLFPARLAGLYTNEPDVVALAVTLLPIAAFFQVFDGTQAVACGILRGAGETRTPMVINLIGYWVLGLPAGLLVAFTFGLGPPGLWWGLTIGLAVCAVLLVRFIWRFLGRR